MQGQQANARVILAVIEPRRSESVKRALAMDAKPLTNDERPGTRQQPTPIRSKLKRRSTS
jgi:hypothetical protein